MYRATALYALRNNFITNAEINTSALVGSLDDIKIELRKTTDGQVATFLNDENIENEIRGVEVSNVVSLVSKIKEVREYLVSLQKAMGSKRNIVMDGRDIGTVVFPGADIKLYMTAQSTVRAQRRFDELTEKGLDVSFEEIKQNIEDRDFNDLNRKESPLKQAEDAIVLDNSHMTIPEQMVWFMNILKEKDFIS